MKFLLSLLAGLMMLAVSAFADVKIGETAPGFALKDLSGKSHKLADYQGKLTVVAFLSAKCPISNAYTERIRALVADYAQRNVAFLAINASADESVGEIKAHAEKNGFTFAILKDKDNKVADAYGAVRTPEIFVVDAAGVLRYHGRIDNSHLPIHVKKHDLRNALDELLAGKAVTNPETKALGCIIKRAQQASRTGSYRTGSVSDLSIHAANNAPVAYAPGSVFGFVPQRKPVAKRPTKPAAAKTPAKPLPKIALLKPADFNKTRDSWKGQVVVLNFWATWCAPCVAEMPEFVKLHNEYNGKGVKVVAMSADDVTDANTLVARFVRDQGLPFQVYVQDTDDPQEMMDLVNKEWPGTLPSTFVYDKTGKLIYSRFKIIDREELTKVITEALK
jgi:peroxiredoxin